MPKKTPPKPPRPIDALAEARPPKSQGLKKRDTWSTSVEVVVTRAWSFYRPGDRVTLRQCDASAFLMAALEWLMTPMPHACEGSRQLQLQVVNTPAPIALSEQSQA